MADAFARVARLEREGKYRFELVRQPGQLRVRALDEQNVMDIPIEWAFGAGVQAVTFVSRVNEDWYLEHYFSYYSAIQSLAPTPGQNVLRAATLPLAMGLLYRTADPDTGILGCFACHSTGPVALSADNQIRPSEAGVHCEACHGPGSAHIAGKLDAIDNPSQLTAAELNRFCGTCHRPPAAKGVSIDWNYAWNVRHQPVYLSQSACFRKSSGKLTCLTCHDPHGPLEHKPGYYNVRCAKCHTVAHDPPAKVCLAATAPDCTGCHMPRISPQPYLKFTNHWIGKYRPGQALKPYSAIR